MMLVVAGVSSTAQAGQSASGRDDPRVTRRPVVPPGLDLSQVRGPDQRHYPSLPINSRAHLPNPDRLREDHSPRRTAHNCYPPGTGGYQENCVNPNYQLAGDWVSHYGVDPYNGQNVARYVYVVDEMEGTRASQWLAWYLSYLNQYWWPQQPNGIRPYFLYFSGSWLRAQHPAYANYHGCNGSLVQFMEFCPTVPGRSSASWSIRDSQGHVGTGDARIGALHATPGGAGDPYVEYSVVHEFGHLHGLAHTDECASVMTYCWTVGNQYLFYSATDYAVLASIYDSHVG